MQMVPQECHASKQDVIFLNVKVKKISSQGSQERLLYGQLEMAK